MICYFSQRKYSFEKHEYLLNFIVSQGESSSDVTFVLSPVPQLAIFTTRCFFINFILLLFLQIAPTV